MSFFNFFGGNKKTAGVAKERLQLILAHERSASRAGSDHDFLPQMKNEILQVISKYMKIDVNDLTVSMDRQDNLDVLEVKIEFPDGDENTSATTKNV